MDNAPKKVYNIQIECDDTAMYALLGQCKDLGITIKKNKEYKPNPEAAERMRKARNMRLG